MKTLNQLHYEYQLAMYREEIAFQRYGLNSSEYEEARQATYKASEAYWNAKERANG